MRPQLTFSFGPASITFGTMAGLVLAVAAVGCGYNPHYLSGHTKCATSGDACPSGYQCRQADNVCVSIGAGGSGQAGSGTAGGGGQGPGGAAGTAGTTGSGGIGGAPGTAGSGQPAGAGGTGGSAGATGLAGHGGTSGTAGTGAAGSGTAGTAGGCGDITMSPANCGACGHACGAGQCTAGVCQPFVVPGVTASSIAVDSGNLYFTQSTKVLRCPEAGCGGLAPAQLDDMGPTGYGTWSVNVTNGSLFFMSSPTQSGTEHDDLFMCMLAGCPSPAPTVATARYGVAYLWNSGSDIYYSDTDAKATYRRACLPNGGTCDATVTIIPEGVDQRLLAASATEFYFVDALGLQKCPYAGCPGTTAAATGATLLLGPVGAGSLPTEVFYFNGLIYLQFGDTHTLSGAIRTCNPVDCDGHVAKPIIQGHDVLVGLSVDAQGEYWIEGTTLYMCAANGCLGGAKTLATGVTHTFNPALSTRPIVTDDAFVYWLNDDAGVVKAVAK